MSSASRKGCMFHVRPGTSRAIQPALSGTAARYPTDLISKLMLSGTNDFTEFTTAQAKRLQFRAEFYNLTDAPSSSSLEPISTPGPGQTTMVFGELRLQRTQCLARVGLRLSF